MKKYITYFALFFWSIAFILIFKYSTLVKESIVDSLTLWATVLIPSMLPIYIVTDLLLNYGLQEVFYKLFKSNTILLVLISLLSGTPTNAKYIVEFYEHGYIGEKTGNFLLLFSYSPNPLFVIAFSPDLGVAMTVLSYIYLSNLAIFLIFKPKFSLEKNRPISASKSSFIDCLSSSIMKSSDVLILILGVVVVYGIANSFAGVFGIDSYFFSSLLELTNALNIIKMHGFSLLWFMFACTFGGLSIHTQIRSILEGTPLAYKYFSIGRLLASLPLLGLIVFR